MASIIKAEETGARKAQPVFADGAMVLTTPDGVVERWDEDAERLLGFTADEAIGQSLQRLVIPAETTDELTATLDSMRHDGRVQHVDAVWKAKNGTAMYVSIILSPIHGNAGEITAASIAIWNISGRKADETRLQLFRALLDRSSDAIEVIDQSTLRYIDVNETACNTLGYTRDELLSMRVPDIDHDLSEPQWKKLEEDLQTTPSVTIESFHRRKDGSKFPVEVNVSLVRFADLEFRIAVVRDISKRKSDEVNLKVFRALLDKAGDGIEVIDPVTLRFLDVNEAICRMHGYSREEMVSMHIPDLDPYLGEERLKEVNDTLQEKRSVTFESLHRRKDGSTFPVEINISLVRILDRDYRLALVRDITERRKSEEAQTLFRSLVDNSNDTIEVIEPDTMRFLDVNQTGCRQLGYSREELQSMTVRDIDMVSTERDEAITEQMRTSGAARFETMHRRKDGSTFPVEVSVKLIELDRPYLLSIVRDITERRQMETELRESEAAYRTLAHNLPGLVYRVFIREGGRMKFYNDMATQITGYAGDELTSGTVCSIDPLIHDEDRPVVVAEVGRAIAENRPFTVEYRLKHKDGGMRWLIEHGMPTRGAAAVYRRCHLRQHRAQAGGRDPPQA